MKHSFLVLIVFLSYYQIGATTYYLSNTGDDNHDGKSKKSSWCSLQKLSESSHLIQLGDSILLERGSVFRGQLNLTASDLYIGAYGLGDKPIISGSLQIQRWKREKRNIWKTTCNSCIDEPGNLFIDGVSQPVGRFPNTGYRTFSSSSNSQSSITDNNLQAEDDYWNKAELVVKSNRWVIDVLPITSYKKKTFITSSPPSYLLQDGFGYFIQKHLGTLDKQGEWFYEAATKQLFIYLNTGTKPSEHTIEISTVNVGLQALHADNLTIEDITISNYREVGIRIKNSISPKLNHVDIVHTGKNGLEIINCHNPCIENSRIADSNNNGVEWINNSGGVFTTNTICRTGLHAGRGRNGDGTYIALHITSDTPYQESNLIENNIIDSTGYSGIDFRTGYTTIKSNHISNFCLTKDDGGGIYTWSNEFGNTVIESNTITNGIGSGAGTNQVNQQYASGIYIDDRSSHILIKNNTISNCATAGIFLHNSKTIHLFQNTAIGNGTSIANKERGQLYIKLDTLGRLGGKVALDLHITENKWVASDETMYGLYVSTVRKTDRDQLGLFMQNVYTTINPRQAVAASSNQRGLCFAPEEFSLEDWKDVTLYEKGSRSTQLPTVIERTHRHKNLIKNGTMNFNVNGWNVWPENSTLVHKKMKLLNRSSLNVIVSPENASVLVYHEGFSLRQGKLYRLSFSAKSLEEIKLEFVPLMSSAPWQALGDYACFSINTNTETFIYYFRPDVSQASARVNFKSNRTFWIGNVSLYEIVEPVVE